MSPGFLDFQPRERFDIPLYSMTLAVFGRPEEKGKVEVPEDSVARPAIFSLYWYPAQSSPNDRCRKLG